MTLCPYCSKSLDKANLDCPNIRHNDTPVSVSLTPSQIRSILLGMDKQMGCWKHHSGKMTKAGKIWLDMRADEMKVITDTLKDAVNGK